MSLPSNIKEPNEKIDPTTWTRYGWIIRKQDRLTY